MKKLGYILIIVILLVVIGWLVYNNYYVSEETTPTVNENSSTPTTEVDTNLTEDQFKTYVSDNGFSFDYPTGYTVSEVTDPTVAGGYVVHIVEDGVPVPSMQITVGPVDTEFALWEGAEWDYFDQVKESFTRRETKKYSELTHEQADDYIATVSQQAILAIRDKDPDKIKTHPVKGVRFSPYAHVDLENDIVLKAVDFTSDQEYTWGSYDGKGTPITMTLDKYWDQFVYNKDFNKAQKIRNNETVGSGNTNNNILEAYPDAITVEYYYPGSAEYDQMDWASLRLSFEKYEGQWYITGITHDQWTI